MSSQQIFDETHLSPYSAQDLAAEVAAILTQRLNAKDLVKLFHVVYLEVSEVAEILRVKDRTIYTWISQDRIPVRYANGKPLFLLPEILQWTLPENDKHAKYRLPSTNHSNIAASRLAAIRERN